jgi:hypothetical protein
MKDRQGDLSRFGALVNMTWRIGHRGLGTAVVSLLKESSR